MTADIEKSQYHLVEDEKVNAHGPKKVHWVVAAGLLGAAAVTGVHNASVHGASGLYSVAPPAKSLAGAVKINALGHPDNGRIVRVIPENFMGYVQMLLSKKSTLTRRLQAVTLGQLCVEDRRHDHSFIDCFKREDLTQASPAVDTLPVEEMYATCKAVGYDKVKNSFNNMGGAGNAFQFLGSIMSNSTATAENWLTDKFSHLSTCRFLSCKAKHSHCDGTHQCVCDKRFSSQDGHTCVSLKAEHPKMKLPSAFSFEPGVPGLEGKWYGVFEKDQTTSILKLSSKYRPRTAGYVHVPNAWGLTQTVSAGAAPPIIDPIRDLDDPIWLDFETTWTKDGTGLSPTLHKLVYDAIFPFSVACALGFTKDMATNNGEFDDMLIDHNDTLNDNNWNNLLLVGPHNVKSKKDYMKLFYKGQHMRGGMPSWPEEEINWSGRFHNFKTDEWSDRTEQALAFQSLGAHRLVVVPVHEAKNKGCDYAGDLEYAVKLNTFALFDVRPGFDRYGSDMYFDADGMPRAIVTRHGKCVTAADPVSWQYYKFVWRSTLVSINTVVDHLHMTHFRTAGLMARASRENLPPQHALRRVFTICTFGTASVNLLAVHTLTEPNAALHRATPFTKDALSQINVVAQTKLVVPPEELHKHFLDDKEWDKLPEKFKQIPYFMDGRVVFKEVQKMVAAFTEIDANAWFDEDGKLTDPYIQDFAKALTANGHDSGYVAAKDAWITRKTFERSLTAYIWTVTGWHRHVGKVADFYIDPDFASTSWKTGERSARPRQVVTAGSITIFTGMPQPKIVEDYTHVFEDCRRISKLFKRIHTTSCVQQVEDRKRVWTNFQQSLLNADEKVAANIATRTARGEVSNTNGRAREIEISVCV